MHKKTQNTLKEQWESVFIRLEVESDLHRDDELVFYPHTGELGGIQKGLFQREAIRKLHQKGAFEHLEEIHNPTPAIDRTLKALNHEPIGFRLRFDREKLLSIIQQARLGLEHGSIEIQPIFEIQYNEPNLSVHDYVHNTDYPLHRLTYGHLPEKMISYMFDKSVFSVTKSELKHHLRNDQIEVDEDFDSVLRNIKFTGILKSAFVISSEKDRVSIRRSLSKTDFDRMGIDQRALRTELQKYRNKKQVRKTSKEG